MHVRQVSPIVLLCALTLAAEGQETRRVRPGLVLDGRLAQADASPGWLEGGLGKTRYGGEGTRARLAQLSLLLDAEATAALGAHVQLNVDAEPGAGARRGVLSPIEAFVYYRPALGDALTLRLKAGQFFPPVSLEHTGRAWTSPYSLTPSALGAWIGEEVRVTGAELGLALRRGRHEVRVESALFGWNDPAGALLAWRGFALHDRQTGRFQLLPLPSVASIGPRGTLFRAQPLWTRPQHEVDDTPGYYAGGRWTMAGRFELRALHYDTRANPAGFRGSQYGWALRFASYAARLELPGALELVVQQLEGRSQMGLLPDGSNPVDFVPRASYVLVSKRQGRHRLSARYDDFQVRDLGPLVSADDQNEDGRAWTLAYSLGFGARHRVFLEWLRVESTRAGRADLAQAAYQRETLVQLGLRLDF